MFRSSQHNILVLFIDMDGCFYGYYYEFLMAEFILNYQAVIESLPTLTDADIYKICSDLSAIPLRSLSEDEHDDFANWVGETQRDWLANEGLAHPNDDYLPYVAHVIRLLQQHAPAIYETILLRSNQAIIDYASAESKRICASHIKLVSGTNRINSQRDHQNYTDNGTGSAFVDLEIFEKLMSKELSLPVSLEKWTVLDAFQSKGRGHTFNRAASLYRTSFDMAHKQRFKVAQSTERYCVDRSKVTTVVGASHRIQQDFTTAGITPVKLHIRFLDDNGENIQYISQAFDRNCPYGNRLLSTEMSFRTIAYTGTSISDDMLSDEVAGAGPLDPNSDQTIKSILTETLCEEFFEPGIDWHDYNKAHVDTNLQFPSAELKMIIDGRKFVDSPSAAQATSPKISSSQP